MTDYIACGKVVPTRIADIVAGIARACSATGTALVGSETAGTRGCSGPTTTTWPAPRSARWRRMRCAGPTGCATAIS